MIRHAPRMIEVARQARQDPQRSPLFHWLTKHHARLASELTGKRINWAPVIAAAVCAGVKDGLGHDPIKRTVRRTWNDVCAAKAASDAAQAAKPPRKLQPRDLPVDWRPTPIGAPSQAPASVVAPVAASQPGTALVPSSYYTPPRVVGQASFGKITSGPLTPEPDYTGMDDVERKIARAAWSIALRKTG